MQTQTIDPDQVIDDLEKRSLESRELVRNTTSTPDVKYTEPQKKVDDVPKKSTFLRKVLYTGAVALATLALDYGCIREHEPFIKEKAAIVSSGFSATVDRLQGREAVSTMGELSDCLKELDNTLTPEERTQFRKDLSKLVKGYISNKEEVKYEGGN
jgi:hypothetical protein